MRVSPSISIRNHTTPRKELALLLLVLILFSLPVLHVQVCISYTEAHAQTIPDVTSCTERSDGQPDACLTWDVHNVEQDVVDKSTAPLEEPSYSKSCREDLSFLLTRFKGETVEQEDYRVYRKRHVPSLIRPIARKRSNTPCGIVSDKWCQEQQSAHIYAAPHVQAIKKLFGGAGITTVDVNIARLPTVSMTTNIVQLDAFLEFGHQTHYPIAKRSVLGLINLCCFDHVEIRREVDTQSTTSKSPSYSGNFHLSTHMSHQTTELEEAVS